MRRLAPLLLMIAAAPVHAADLERANAEIQQLHFDRALEALDVALRAGDNSPARLARIHRLLGVVSASLGLADAAVGHFEHWLMLEPAGQLDEGASPKLLQPLADARRLLQDRPPLSLRYRLDPAAPSITLLIDSDPLTMVAGVRAIVHRPGGAPATVEQRGGVGLTIPLPPGRLEVELFALDRHGNRLVELGTISVGAVGRRPRARPWLARWYLWGGAALASAAIGTGFAIAETMAQGELDRATQQSWMHDFREVRALEQSARSDALGVNISFAIAGAFAITSVVLLGVEARARRLEARP
jgi:hypothetical protein